jgi:hypothetical protein
MPTGTEIAENVVPIDTGIIRARLTQPQVSTPLPGVTFRGEEHSKFPPESVVFDATGSGTHSHKGGSAPKLSQFDLYPVRHALSPEHVTALTLLASAVRYTELALSAMRDGDDIGADSETQKVQVLLPELFCCRALGDGFGSVVNSVMSAFESLQGNPLSLPQLRAVNQILNLLRDKPFLTVDEADQRIEQLEAVNLSPYPPELVEFLSSGKGVR